MAILTSPPGETSGEYIHPPDCFACGTETHPSLRMSIDSRHHSATTRCVVPTGMHGISGIVHGGIVVAILDETMGAVAGFGSRARMTLSLDTRFHRPTETGRLLLATAQVIEARVRSFSAHAEIRHHDDGTLLAEANGVFVLVDMNGGQENVRQPT